MDKLDGAAIVVPGVEVRVVERCTSTNELLLKEAEPVIVRSAQKGIVHRNAASRKVSRLTLRIAKLGK